MSSVRPTPPFLRRTTGPHARGLAALVLVVAFAGCAGDASPPASDANVATSPRDTTGPAPPPGAVPAVFDQAFVHETVWSNGTFHPADSNWPSGAVLGAPHDLTVVPLTDLVPRNVPVRLIAEVNAGVAETPADGWPGDGDVDLWFNVPFEEVWTGTWDTPFGGYSRVEVTIIHASDAPLEAVLAYGELGAGGDVPYALRVDVLAYRETLLDGVTVEVPLEGPGAELILELWHRGEAPAVLLWDSDDEFVGRFPIQGDRFNWTVPSDRSGGAYVLMLAQGSGHAQIWVRGADGGEVTLGTTRQDIVQHQYESSGEEASWSYDADRMPIQTGVFALGNTVNQDFSMTVDGPEGNLIDVSFTGGPWWGLPRGFGTGEWVPMGAAGLAPGAYHAQFSFGVAAGTESLEYGDFLVYYQR